MRHHSLPRRLPAALLLAAFLPAAGAAADPLLDEATGFAGGMAFLGSGAPGLVIAAIRDGETAFAGFGETARGSGQTPGADTLMRVASISKAYCGDVLASLAADGALGLTDPLQDHLPQPFVVPRKDGRSLRIIDLVTQSSGLPRDMAQTGGTPQDPYAGHTTAAQIENLAGDPFLFAPGTGALYSNFGFDLLGAALAEAGGKPYADLLAERVLDPRGMTDTVFAPRPGDEGRMMQGHDFDGAPLPFVPTPATMHCASGLHTTAGDMLKWMAWHLDADDAADAARRRMNHAGWLWRDGLAPVAGLDDGGGPMAAMALGWIVMAPEGDRPMLLHKSGGRQGMFTYVAIAPTRGVGVFVAINQFSASGFALMVQAANGLIAALAPR